ncbi:MAG: D-tyrosyl-tRNA(Tyr) deacylase [Candidatus Melainabacteria bacterium RIFOXYA12_FULL_32_12]|nr:MAG: D-tyrosyl-tRNA(Tyr) deacylase [Candidatus Melainabacteria bacterium GWF2_32_7]OGI21131.1 MAG: D-tyrosyl-tRNA(Tyr) deacylase [Candidatus Melainabacteria bacterium RIFOXYA2_FULL_32_9]OGI31111.1 MAG: D-tyrosyl-tRNA(Tyr) deacylase [Candidatus Melainabacteria bacterium RIFOXYA12_FULL_32_12]
MKAVIQRVKNASVEINKELFSKINSGILVLLGIEKSDTEEQARFLANKIVDLRIFADDTGKMNLSLLDIKGEILVVSQFTLAGDCSKGKRPGFDNAAKPDTAIPLYEKFLEYLEERGLTPKTGKFGAMMDIALVNDGPVTFILSAK